MAVGFFILGVVDYQGFGFRAYLPSADAFYSEDLHLRFFNALLPYLAVVLIQVTSSVGVALVMLGKLRRRPPEARADAFLIFAALIALLVIIGLIVRMEGNEGALNFGYRYVCMVLSEARVAPHVVPESCTSDGLSPLAIFALLPLGLGLIAAALAGGLTSSIFGPLEGDTTEAKEAELDRRGVAFDGLFKATAFLLVTSTMALIFFYRLPLSIIEDPGQTALWTGYASAMTLYWGVLFTLTLVCVFGHGSMRLKAEIERHRTRDTELDFEESLLPKAARERIVTILTTLAPLLIGAAGSVLQTIAAAL